MQSSNFRTRGRLTGAAFLLTFTTLCAAPLAAQTSAANDPCKGRYVRALATPHAVTKPAMKDIAALQARLPQLEASIRTVVAQDASLGPGVADALIKAIRDGYGLSERTMRRDEAVQWMAYQPKPGQYGTIQPACIKLKKDYEAFEITVEVPDPAPPAPQAICKISATRNCEAQNPTISVSIVGSSPGGRVTMSGAGSAPVELTAAETWTIADPGPYDTTPSFTLASKSAAPANRTARVYRFLMPKVCGNLSYLGEGPPTTLPPVGAATNCSQIAQTTRCAAPIEPVDTPPVSDEVASCDETGWVARGMAFGFFPSGSAQERAIEMSGNRGPANERFELEDGYGLGFSAEKRISQLIGIEAGFLFGRGDTVYTLSQDVPPRSGQDSHKANFYALMVGPNFHFTECGGVDFYVGPFIGYGGYADPNYWVFDHHFHAAFDGRFIWGAQLGLDVPFDSSQWGFHGGLRYIDVSQDTDAGSIAVDPWILELGLAYRF